ncbi:sushi, von Willebrand factor type A, EGF and pentraxin domain-containing protein 1-like [Littorina saxatilis]|uniref:sushi, von Willebrand factor type A, EGF and pentraxin domain-containing protein 1-like n=1 Tax=Littorina saxatilis TaxID=31220 RepID=UPI0038B41C36
MERLCGPLSSATLVAFFIFISNVNGACNNVKTDAYCAAKLAVANFCYLSSTERCGCEKDCKTPPYCNEPSNLDSTCDCPFNAANCAVYAWLHSYCASTCSLRFSVTCDPLITVIGASPLFNDDPPTNSSVTPKYMDVVTFTCDPGWQQTSGSTSNQLRRVCIADGSWVLHPDYQESLVCERVSCGSVPNVTNATPSQNAGVFEDTVTYTCDLGYNTTGQGQGNRTCNATSQWEQMEDDPVCEVVECGAPLTLYQAEPSASSGVYLSIITYSCQSGYIQSGTGVGRKQCAGDGQWTSVANDPDIVCAPKPCIALATILNAVPSLPFGVYRDIVTYTCAPGYSQSGGSTGKRTCTAAGTWFVENADPVCTRIGCGAPPSRIGATASATIGYLGENVTYACDQSHVRVGGGSGHVTCNLSALWEEDATDSVPLCLGMNIKFVNSRSEAQMAPPGALTSASARSNLHCASFCALSVYCHGYSFNKQSGACAMNNVSPHPVVTDMKKVYF